MGKRLRLRRKTREAPVGTLEVLEEVGDAPGTTRHSVDAEPDINKVALHPERYIEINIIKKTRVVDSFYIFASDKNSFSYKKKTYHIKEEGIYLLPRKGFFVATSFYYEDTTKPVHFKQMNKGITGKALTLLYKSRLYSTLLKADEPNYNLFVLVLLIAQMILFGVALFFLFQGCPGGGSGIPVGGL